MIQVSMRNVLDAIQDEARLWEVEGRPVRVDRSFCSQARRRQKRVRGESLAGAAEGIYVTQFTN